MVTVSEVTTKKQIKQFVNFPLKLYKGNECFVPPLYADELKIFKKDYMYYDKSEAKYWLAYKNNEVVGRISAIIQHSANEKWKQKRVRFTRFDSIDDQEVANALFNKVEEYAKEKKMEEVVGPLGFSDLEREGLLIEGFDYLNTFEEQYNYPYYQKLIENLNYKKEVDWIEHRLVPIKERAERVIALKNKILAKGQLRLVCGTPLKKFAKQYKEKFFEILDVSYDKIYGTVPFTEGMKDMLLNNFSPIINTKYFPAVVDKDDNIVAFGLAFPGMGEIFQKSKGHLYPVTAIKLLWNVKHPKTIDLGLVGIAEENQLSGAQVVVFGAIVEQMLKDKIIYSETNLNLETNSDVLAIWKNFDTIQHKRRRSFVKKI